MSSTQNSSRAFSAQAKNAALWKSGFRERETLFLFSYKLIPILHIGKVNQFEVKSLKSSKM